MIQLSNNRLYRTPMFRTSKGEINDIHWKTVILVFTEILMQAGIPFFVYARLWHPVSKNFAYSIIVVIAIIAILAGVSCYGILLILFKEIDLSMFKKISGK